MKLNIYAEDIDVETILGKFPSSNDFVYRFVETREEADVIVDENWEMPVLPVDKSPVDDVSPTDKCFILGCAYNCGKYIDAVFSNIRKLGGLFSEYKVAIAYDPSPDDTLSKLLRQNVDKIIYCNNSHIPERTHRIANARNELIKWVRQNYGREWKYMIMLDCDDVCSGELNLDVVSEALSKEELWESVSFNRDDYYDIWALSFDPYAFSCWHWKFGRAYVDYVKGIITQKLAAMNQDEYMECYSAFNGLALYKTAVFMDCTYLWSSPMVHFTSEMIHKNMEAVGGIMPLAHNCWGTKEDCEHRSFHLEAIRKYGARIRICPKKLWA